ncbi:MAG: hypothetical protein ACRCX2_21630 [Paraclostridium sp.]
MNENIIKQIKGGVCLYDVMGSYKDIDKYLDAKQELIDMMGEMPSDSFASLSMDSGVDESIPNRLVKAVKFYEDIESMKFAISEWFKVDTRSYSDREILDIYNDIFSPANNKLTLMLTALNTNICRLYDESTHADTLIPFIEGGCVFNVGYSKIVSESISKGIKDLTTRLKIKEYSDDSIMNVVVNNKKCAIFSDDNGDISNNSIVIEASNETQINEISRLIGEGKACLSYGRVMGSVLEMLVFDIKTTYTSSEVDGLIGNQVIASEFMTSPGTVKLLSETQGNLLHTLITQSTELLTLVPIIQDAVIRSI